MDTNLLFDTVHTIFAKRNYVYDYNEKFTKVFL